MASELLFKLLACFFSAIYPAAETVFESTDKGVGRLKASDSCISHRRRRKRSCCCMRSFSGVLKVLPLCQLSSCPATRTRTLPLASCTFVCAESFICAFVRV
eukprot:6214707-Pleurochrysis_carterae.AAC.6